MIKWIQASLLSLLLLCTGFAHAETTIYYHTDALGSPVAATDEQGIILWRENYAPYGDRLLKQDGGTENTWYTGKQHDEGIGLSYFGARWYDPVHGRFMAMDPVGFQEDNIHSFNKYAYANNNPYKFVDPDGEAALLAIIALGAGALLYSEYANAPTPLDTPQSTSLLNKLSTLQPELKGAALGLGAIGIIKNGDKIAAATKKLSKVKKEVRKETIGDGKFTKITKVIPGKGPGQSRSEMEFIKNSEGKLIRSRKLSFDRGNKFQHKKPARGGPEGRPANEN